MGASLAKGHAHFSSGYSFFGGPWQTQAVYQIWSP